MTIIFSPVVTHVLWWKLTRLDETGPTRCWGGVECSSVRQVGRLIAAGRDLAPPLSHVLEKKRRK